MSGHMTEFKNWNFGPQAHWPPHMGGNNYAIQNNNKLAI